MISIYDSWHSVLELWKWDQPCDPTLLSSKASSSLGSEVHRGERRVERSAGANKVAALHVHFTTPHLTNMNPSADDLPLRPHNADAPSAPIPDDHGADLQMNMLGRLPATSYLTIFFWRPHVHIAHQTVPRHLRQGCTMARIS